MVLPISDIFKIETKPKAKTIEVVIESDVGMLIPENYIDDENTRLETYQKLSKVQTYEELDSIKDELTDRFGKFPDEVISLFKHVELKIEAINSGFEKIVISGNTAELYFHLSEDNPAMADGRFERMITYINQKNSDDARLIQTKKSLLVKYKLFEADSGVNKLEEVTDIIKAFKEA